MAVVMIADVIASFAPSHNVRVQLWESSGWRTRRGHRGQARFYAPLITCGRERQLATAMMMVMIADVIASFALSHNVRVSAMEIVWRASALLRTMHDLWEGAPARDGGGDNCRRHRELRSLPQYLHFTRGSQLAGEAQVRAAHVLRQHHRFASKLAPTALR
jgi:hypothetical protein